MAILSDAARSVWALQGRNFTYGIGVDAQGRLKNIHFGALVTNLAELGNVEFGYPGGASFDPPGGLAQFEYPANGYVLLRAVPESHLCRSCA